ACRKSGSPKFAQPLPKPPTNPFTPTIPIVVPASGRIVCAWSSTITPASPSAFTISGVRSECQSWLPRIATTGTARSRAASATTRASSSAPCCVRSPAKSARSAHSSSFANAVATRSASSTPAWRSAVAAMRTLRDDSCTPVTGRPVHVVDDFETMLEAMRNAAAALRDAGIPFALAGSVAIYARGGADTRHDVDFLVRPQDAERALDVLTQRGFRPERPPEGWLYKAYDPNGIMIDLIFGPVSGTVDDELLARAEPVEVHAITVPALPVTDILAGKLLALREHYLDLAPALEIARSVREQIDWPELRRRTNGSPYAKAFFAVVEELGLDRPASG